MRNPFRRVFPWHDTMFTFWLSMAAVAVTVVFLLLVGIPAYFWFVLQFANVNI